VVLPFYAIKSLEPTKGTLTTPGGLTFVDDDGDSNAGTRRHFLTFHAGGLGADHAFSDSVADLVVQLHAMFKDSNKEHPPPLPQQQQQQQPPPPPARRIKSSSSSPLCPRRCPLPRKQRQRQR